MFNSIFGGTYAIDDNIDISIMRTRQYFDYLIKYCFNRFKWDLPEKSRMPYFLPEYLLSIFGHYAIFYSKDITNEIVFVTGGFTGKINNWGMYTGYIGTTPNGETYEGTIGEDCVVIGNNSLYRPDKQIVCRFAHLLNEIDKSLDLNIYNTRLTKGFIADNDKDKMAIETAYKAVGDGKPFVAVAPTHRPMTDVLDATQDGLYTPFDFTTVKDADKLQYLSRLYDDIIGRFLAMYGIDTGNVNKGSQILENEISRLAEASAVPIEDAYLARKYGIEQYKKVFNRDDIKITRSPLYGCDTAINEITEEGENENG
jgi:hypothetical protein|nr:MAG TPA: upper collar protein [Caudoviricetes sp.]